MNPNPPYQYNPNQPQPTSPPYPGMQPPAGTPSTYNPNYPPNLPNGYPVNPNYPPAPYPATPQSPAVYPTPYPPYPNAPNTPPLKSPFGSPSPVASGPINNIPSGRTDDHLSTSATLMMSELRDGLVIMKDGSFRAVIACQSINFDLMSNTEREGVEYSFQNFLNSLGFTTQILIRSQRVDIGPYIESLAKIRRENDNILLGVLMDDYINFIDLLSQEANIMDKSFFIVIPYYSSAEMERAVQETKNFFRTFSSSKTDDITRIDRATYNKAVTEINNRVEAVIAGLFQIGIRSIRLNTQELASMYYNFNNPDTAVRQPLVDFSKLATVYVKKGENNV